MCLVSAGSHTHFCAFSLIDLDSIEHACGMDYVVRIQICGWIYKYFAYGTFHRRDSNSGSLPLIVPFRINTRSDRASIFSMMFVWGVSPAATRLEIRQSGLVSHIIDRVLADCYLVICAVNVFGTCNATVTTDEMRHHEIRCS